VFQNIVRKLSFDSLQRLKRAPNLILEKRKGGQKKNPLASASPPQALNGVSHQLTNVHSALVEPHTRRAVNSFIIINIIHIKEKFIF
jgi:hypothetical protein